MCWQGLVFRFPEKKLGHFTGKAEVLSRERAKRRNHTAVDNILIYAEICVRNSISLTNPTSFSIGQEIFLLIMALQKLLSALKGYEK